MGKRRREREGIEVSKRPRENERKKTRN